jgi:hypothetical protein
MGIGMSFYKFWEQTVDCSIEPRGPSAKHRPMSILTAFSGTRAANRVPERKAPHLPRDIQAKIGEGLRAHYEPPQEMPHRLLTLLIQMDEREDEIVTGPLHP